MGFISGVLLAVFLLSGSVFGAATCYESFEEMAGLAERLPSGHPRARGEAGESQAEAREAAIFLVETLYALGDKDYPTGHLKVPTEPLTLYRSRFLALMGEGTKVPMQYLADVETEARRSRILVRTLEEKVWEKERARMAADSHYQPETVRQIVNIITRVVERKELSPLADFINDHYDDALAIVSLSTQVDELKWRLATLLTDAALPPAEAEEPEPRAPKGMTLSSLWDRVRSVFSRGAAGSFMAVPSDPAAKATKELLIKLARPIPGPLSGDAISALEKLARPADGRVARPDLKLQLTDTIRVLKDKETELAEAQVSYYRHYRAAAVMKKLLRDLACGDGKTGIESYSVLRETLDLTLGNHPYVRVLIASAYPEGSQYYHPYLCTKLPMPKKASELSDPVIAAQVLTPDILPTLFEESKRKGLEGVLRDIDDKAYRQALGEVEAVMRQSFVNVASKALKSPIVSEPLYENMIGPALLPVLEKLKHGEKPAPSAHDEANDPAKDKDKDKDKKRSPSVYAPELIPVLLERIQTYLGADNVRMDWSGFPFKLSEQGLQEEKVDPEKEKEKGKDKDKENSEVLPEDPYSPIDRYDWDDPYSRRRRPSKPVKRIDFAKGYAWVSKVYAILDTRAETIAGADRKRAELEYRKEFHGEAIPAGTPTVEALVAERAALVRAFVDVEHAIEACGMSRASVGKRALADDEAEEEALRAVAFFLKKYPNLLEFMVSHVGNDPTLRELWLKLFVRVTNSHLSVPRNLSPKVTPAKIEDTRPAWKRWLNIGGYGVGIGAILIGGATYLYPHVVKDPHPKPPPPPITAPLNPGNPAPQEAVGQR